jgi:putative phosphoribosyl transferase
MGAIANGGVRVLNDERAAAGEALELQRREQSYRGLRPECTIAGKTILLVDDGLAIGSTMRAAIVALRSHHPARTVAAAPVAAPDSCAAVRAEADAVICAETPEWFASVGRWYADFEQTTDHEVRELLAALSPNADTDAAAQPGALPEENDKRKGRREPVGLWYCSIWRARKDSNLRPPSS